MSQHLYDVPWRYQLYGTDGNIIRPCDRFRALFGLIRDGEPGDIVEVHPDRVDFWLALPDYVTLRTFPDGVEIHKRLGTCAWASKQCGVPSQYKDKEPSERSKFHAPWVEATHLMRLINEADDAREMRHAAITVEPIPFAKMRAAPRLAVDTETDTIKGAKPRPTSDPILGMSVAWADGECWIPADQIQEHFDTLAAIFRGGKELIGHHAKFDEIILHRLGFWGFQFTHDTMLMSYMHGGRYPAGLKHLISQLRGRFAQELGPLINKYGRVGNIPKATLIPYAKADARNTYDAMEDLEKLGINPLYTDLEMPMSRLLCSMEEKGWRVDKVQLDKVEAALDEQMEQAAKELEPYGITSPTKNNEVSAFFIGEGFDLPRTQTGYSVDKDTLGGIDHPAVASLLSFREAHKRKTNWVKVMRDTPDGYIHPSFRQAPISGRLSCSNPNVQNFTYDLRSCLVPDLADVVPPFYVSGADYIMSNLPHTQPVLMAADMSQFELRILAKVSGDPTLIQEFIDGVDIHERNRIDLNLPTRRAAKDTIYGIAYGEGADTLAENLTKKGEPTTVSEAQSFINSIYKKYPGLTAWKKRWLAECKRTQVSKTMAGRERWVPDILYDDPSIRGHAERAAINHPIQGTAGDLMKMGQLIIEPLLQEHGARQLGQIHDEFVISTPNPFATYRAIMKAMEEFQLWLAPVPVKVDVLVGYSWGFK